MQSDKIKYIDYPPVLTLIISVLTITLMFVNLGRISSPVIQYLVILLVYAVIFGLPSFLYVKKFGLDIFKKVTFGFSGGKYIPVTLLISAIIIVQSSILKFGIFRIGYDFTIYSLYGSSIYTGNPNALEWIALFVFVCILPAVCEEFVFRGIIINEYYKCGEIWAIIISSLLFAFVHLSFTAFPIYFLAGILLGILAFMTKSVIYPLIAHFLYNVFTLIFEKYVWLMSSSPDSEVFFWLILVFLYLVFLFILSFVLERHFKSRGKDEIINGPDTTQYAIKPKPYGTVFQRVFLAVPMIGQILIFITVALLVQFLK